MRNRVRRQITQCFVGFGGGRGAVWGGQGWLNGCPLVKRGLRFRGLGL